jgi:hypothetical protein
MELSTGRQRLAERSRRLEACKETQAGRSKQAVLGRNRHAGREAGMGGKQAYRHAKAGWQRRRQECMQAKTSKKAEPGWQTGRLKQTRKSI